MPDRELSVALLEPVERALYDHLMRPDAQEDLTFGLYRLAGGTARDTAIVVDSVLPIDGERYVHGNASFTGAYVERALGTARARECGLVFLHSHPLGTGWQRMSEDDEIAERRIAAGVLAATGLPIVGMTLARDEHYSARRWNRIAPRTYTRQDAVNVRVIGKRLRVSLPPAREIAFEAFDRTDSVWGSAERAKLSRLRVAIVGLGSVGSQVAEILARIGVRQVVLIDHDRVKVINLDRTLNATTSDEGAYKVDVAACAMRAHSPCGLNVNAIPARCDDAVAYRALLDCDFTFCCVDRPWGQRILNHLAYANAIPVSNGGLLARRRKGRFIGADWHVHVVGPGRRCMQCWNAFDPGDAALDRDGFLDDPSYVKNMNPDSPLIAHANAIPYAMSVASMQVMQFIAIVVGPINDLGDWNFHAATGTCDTSGDSGCEDECLYADITGDVRSFPPLR
jgi:hypothetical protein